MGAIPALIALSALWLQDAIATIISFAAVGIYIAFQMIVPAALVRAHARLAAGRAFHACRLGMVREPGWRSPTASPPS